MSDLTFHHQDNHLRTAGLTSIGKAELSIEVTPELSASEAHDLLFSAASLAVSANYRYEIGEVLRHEGRLCRLEPARGHCFLLERVSAEGVFGDSQGIVPGRQAPAR